MRAIDTNVLVRILVDDDAKQSSSAEAFVESGAWVSLVVLAEAVWVLQSVYDRTDAQVKGAIGRMLDLAELSIQDGDVVALALERFGRARGVSFTDCLVLEIARKAGHLPLGTFDRKLARLDGALRV